VVASKTAKSAMMAILVALVLAGCGQGQSPGDDPGQPVGPESEPGGSAPEAGSDPPESTAPPETVDPEGDAAAEEIISDLDAAQTVVNAYWTQHWSEYFTGSYVAPALNDTGGYGLGLYDGNEGSATCGGTVLPAQNAVYCPAEHSVAFDVGLMSEALTLGDTFVYLIVAHEYGHAVAGHLDAELNSVASELQADCLAGAAIYGAVADGTLLLEEGDVKEITNGLTDISDESPWGDPDDHGDPFERIAAFDAGRTDGPGACFSA
jgi:uncharacterized protein